LEGSPEKAGVGGSIPSLATIIFNYLRSRKMSLPDGRLSLVLAKSSCYEQRGTFREGSCLDRALPLPIKAAFEVYGNVIDVHI